MQSTRQQSWVGRIFAAWSGFYDHPLLQQLYYRPVHRRLLRQLNAAPRRSVRVLDAGCGTGQVLADLAGPERQLLGLDLSREMLQHAQDRVPGARLLQGDCQRLPLADASVDLVLNTLSFHWYPQPLAALSEFLRVLRPGGQLLLAGVASSLMGFRGFRSAFKRVVRGGVKLSTAQHLAEKMGKVGFTQVHHERVHVGTWVFSGRRPGGDT